MCRAVFPGYSHPYELPDHAELTLDGATVPVANSVDFIIGYLTKHGYLHDVRGPHSRAGWLWALVAHSSVTCAMSCLRVPRTKLLIPVPLRSAHRLARSAHHRLRGADLPQARAKSLPVEGNGYRTHQSPHFVTSNSRLFWSPAASKGFRVTIRRTWIPYSQ